MPVPHTASVVELSPEPPSAIDAIEEALFPAPPPDAKTCFLGGIFVLLLLAALYTAREIVMPAVLAFVLKLVLQPLLRFLQRKLHVPQTLAAMLIILALLIAGIGLGTAFSGPATRWAERIPDGIPKLQERLGFLKHPIAEAQKLMVHAEDLTKGAGPKAMPVAVQGTRLTDHILAGMKSLAGGLFTTMLVLFFLLVSGDTFLRRLVEILPRFRDKRQVVDISQQIEQDISRYLLTITLINACVGAATGVVAVFTGLGDPVLWGTLAFLLNYIPIIGPLMTVGILMTAGLMTDIDGVAFMPAALYLIIHLTEGMLITPLLLAKRFTLNPVLVIISLIFWYWMWSVPGAILAMPMLAIGKIICDRIDRLKALGHFLEG